MPKLIVGKAEIQAKTALTLFYSFLVLLVVNAFTLYVANQLFPADIVLGTYTIGVFWALLHSMGILSIITTFVIAFVYYHEWKRGKNYSPKEWMLVYFLVDTAAIWLLARFADNLGFGISHWWVAVLLGVALDWLQGLGMMALNKLQQK